MPKFTVYVACNVPNVTHIEIEAPTEEEAQRLALEQAHSEDKWELDWDGSGPLYVVQVFTS